MGSETLLPTPYNLAWIPYGGTEQVEIFSSYNGVPSLGTVTAGDERVLFWRAAFYTQDVSVWLYVPLTADEAARIDDGGDPLDGIVYGLPERRFATVGVANELNRLAFDREWSIPAGLTPDDSFDAIVHYVVEAMDLALSQDPPLPQMRVEMVQRAKEAVRQQLVLADRS